MQEISRCRYGVIDSSATIAAASVAMRLSDAEALLVLGAERCAGGGPPTLSARDIVTGIVALGLDPSVFTVDDLLAVIAARHI